MTQNRDSLQQGGIAVTEDFSTRHIGVGRSEQQEMLTELGLSSLQELIDKVVPPSIRRTDRMEVGEGMGEHEALARLRTMAGKNRLLTSYIGQGYHNTLTPPVIQRNILENPAWYTSYTPYQPEISQGRLEAMFTFQTMVSDLTGFPLANASLLDEATACGEAMALCQRVHKGRGQVFLVAQDAHPQNIEVVQTRADSLGVEVVVADPLKTDLDRLNLFGVLASVSFDERRDTRLPCTVRTCSPEGCSRRGLC